MSEKQPFDFIELPPERTQVKPRSNGLSLMSDWGLGSGAPVIFWKPADNSWISPKLRPAPPGFILKRS